MRRLAVALASLAVMSFAPPAAQSDTLERDLSCLGVMGFAAAALNDETRDAPLRVYFAYFLGRLNSRQPGQPWAERSVDNIRKMDVEQIKTTLITCAAIADRDFQTAVGSAT